MIKAKLKVNYTEVDIEFPCTEQVLQKELEFLYLPGNLSECLLVREIREPEWLKLLEGQDINVDQLNYLAKRLEVMDESELKQYEVAMNYRKISSIKDLINLTFNLSKYTLIEDMRDIENVGRVHFENILGGLGIDESDETNCDFSEIGRQLLESGKGVIVEQGILFENDEVEYAEVYNGKTFPQFFYGDCLAIVEMSFVDFKEYIYLPCDEMEIYKAQMRVHAFHIQSCNMSLSDYSLEEEWKGVFDNVLYNEGIYGINDLAKAVEKLSDKSARDKLLAISEYTGVCDSRGLCVLANTLDSFTFVPNVGNMEQLLEHRADVKEEKEPIGKFTSYGFVYVNGPMDIGKMIEAADETVPTLVGP